MDSMQLWATTYGPRWQEMRAREQALREQAFIEWESEVFGEPIRQMTLRDLHMLQGAGSPFVVEGLIPEPPDVVQFIWVMHRKNKGFLKFINKVLVKYRIWAKKRKDPMGQALKDINKYLDDVFQDAPSGKSSKDSRPLGVCYMALVLTRLGMKLGPFDPATGTPWKDVPLARIFQYIKAINSYEIGKDFKDFSPSDKVMSDWLAESNKQAAQ